MLKVNSFFNTIFSRSEKRKLAEFQRTVQLINDLEPEIEKLSQDMLLKRIPETYLTNLHSISLMYLN